MSDKIHHFLPRLTVNKLLIHELMAAESPCFALGYVEEGGSQSGFIALKPESSIPNQVTHQGMKLGHSVRGTDEGKVLHFAFEFYGHATYHGLVPFGNPMTQAVISTMLETHDYFFFAMNPNQKVTAFRSKLEAYDLAGLRRNQEKFGKEICSLEQYESVVSTFSKNPSPPGMMMTWVCRNNEDYLDLKKYPLVLNPSA